MNAKVNPEGSKFDALVKWVVVIAVVAAGVVGNSIFADQSLFYRVVALLVLALWLQVLFRCKQLKGKAFFLLFKEAKQEIRKVVWPTRQETLQTTAIVVVVVLVVGLMLWGLDSLLSWLVSGAIG